MSRSFVILIFIVLMGCDTADSVKPRNEDFFVKLIGVEDDDYGNDVIQAADGGYVIVGRHESADDPESDFLIIKTNRSGNAEWINTEIQKGEAVSVVEVDGSFVVGGTVGVGDDRRSVIIKVDASGNIVNVPVFIETVNSISGIPYFNELRKITRGPSGLSVSGITGVPSGDSPPNSQRGFMALLDETDLSRIEYLPGDPETIVQYLGTDGNDNIIGVFENSLDGVESYYLVMGSTKGNLNGDVENYYFELRDAVGEPVANPPTLSLDLSGNQIATSVVNSDNTYYISGYTDVASLAQTALVRLDLRDVNGTIEVTSDRGIEIVSSSETNFDTYARGIALKSATSKVIVADVGVIDQTDEVVRSTATNVQALDANNNMNWNREFGTLNRNYAGAVIIDDRGSIVTVGTNDLESQFKVVLIKTGPNGQMSF